MKVPKYIKEAIEKNSIYAMRANENNTIIRNWLEKQGVIVGEGTESTEHEVIIDMLIDMVEQDIRHIEFIKFLERYKLN